MTKHKKPATKLDKRIGVYNSDSFGRACGVSPQTVLNHIAKGSLKIVCGSFEPWGNIFVVTHEELSRFRAEMIENAQRLLDKRNATLAN